MTMEHRRPVQPEDLLAIKTITDVQIHVAQDGYIAVRLAYTGQLHICHIASP